MLRVRAGVAASGGNTIASRTECALPARTRSVHRPGTTPLLVRGRDLANPTVPAATRGSLHFHRRVRLLPHPETRVHHQHLRVRKAVQLVHQQVDLGFEGGGVGGGVGLLLG